MSLKAKKSTLEVGATMDTLEKIGEIRSMEIITDEKMSIHCTVIRRKGNKPIAGKVFEFDVCSKEEALQRIKAYFIMKGLFGELDHHTYDHFYSLSEGKKGNDKNFTGFIEQFDRLFRCII